MLVIQQNYRKGYEGIIFLLKARLSLNAIVKYIQELFLRNQSIFHMGFNFY